MAIITRAEKGSPLSFAELDNNFIELNTKASNAGKVGTKTVDETNIATGSILEYNGIKLVYVKNKPNVTLKDDSSGATISFNFAKESFIEVNITTDVIFTGINLEAGHTGKIFVYQGNFGGHSISFDSSIFIPDSSETIQPEQGGEDITWYEFNVYSSSIVFIRKIGYYKSITVALVNSSGDIIAINTSGDELAL